MAKGFKAGQLKEFNAKMGWKLTEANWATPIMESFDDFEKESWEEWVYLKKIIQLHESVGE
jgi:hypothetical protein